MRPIALFLIRIYGYFSRMFPCRCIYIPTCSQYAREAFLRYPSLKALKLVFFRLLRCNPWAKGGFDPVSPANHKSHCLKSVVFSNGVK